MAILLLLSAPAAPLLAESLPGPPDWADSAASVYSGMKPAGEADRPPPTSAAAVTTAVALPATPTPRVDLAVAPANYEAPQEQSANPRRLSPPKGSSQVHTALAPEGGAENRSALARPTADFGMPLGSLFTMASALGIVIGAFLLFAWLMRRGGGKAAAALPGEVVTVLGRVPLAARQFAQLLRVGNKLVLISVTPTGADMLTEITDPAEVDRLVGLCQQYAPNSTTKAFEHVFRQLSSEPASGGFLGGDSLPPVLSSTGTTFRSRPEEAIRV